MRNEFGCNLYIDTENNNPIVINELTNTKATEIVVKGEPFISPKGKKIKDKINEYNLWVLKSERIIADKSENLYLELAIERTLEILDKNKEAFIEVLKRFPKNHLLCYGYFGEFNPYFCINNNLLKKLNTYNLSIEFDIYFLKGRSKV